MQSVWHLFRAVFLLLLIGFVPSCTESPDADPVMDLVEEYRRLTSGEGTREEIVAVRRQLIDAYVTYVDAHPDDSLAVVYLDQAAELHAAEPSESLEAITLFDRLLNEYPQSGKAAEALFMKAYIFNNSLQDYDKARQFYLEFLESFPDHGLASDARNELKNIGMSTEEIFRSLPIDSVNALE